MAGRQEHPLAVWYIVACPQPGKYLHVHAAALPAQSLYIFHPQNAIGTLQQGGSFLSNQLCRRLLAPLGKGKGGVGGLQSLGEGRGVQQGCQVPQGF